MIEEEQKGDEKQDMSNVLIRDNSELKFATRHYSKLTGLRVNITGGISEMNWKLIRNFKYLQSITFENINEFVPYVYKRFDQTMKSRASRISFHGCNFVSDEWLYADGNFARDGNMERISERVLNWRGTTPKRFETTRN